MTDPYSVCHRILQIGNESGVSDITTLKIIKLAYISHGFHLGYLGKPLFDDDVEAWPYGPVIPRIYHAVSHFRGKPIPYTLFQHREEPMRETSDQIIRAVMKTYAKYDGLHLSSLTHKEGTPWDQTKKSRGIGATIPTRMIEQYYGKVIGDNS